MIGSTNRIERRLQLAGILLILGLLTEAVCLFWARPLSFVTFISIGGAFLFLGVLVYLLSLLTTRPSQRNGEKPKDCSSFAPS
jgi:hypothetical protein